MYDFYHAILIGLVPALVSSIATDFIAVILSLRQFYSQKWWEKKAKNYSAIIEELSYIQYYYGELYDESFGIKSLSKNVLKGFEDS